MSGQSSNGYAANGQTPRRVVITGVGAITPLGLSVDETWENLLNGVSGIHTVDALKEAELRTTFAGRVQGFQAKDYMDRKEARRLDPVIQYAIAASQAAIADSGLDLDAEERNRIGVIIGSGIGGINTTFINFDVAERKGVRRVSPFMIPNMLVDSPAGKVAIAHDLRGPNHSVVSACASGTSACGEAFEVIRRNDADMMVAGGAEAAVLPIVVAAFDVMGALSQRNDNPEGACRPFSVDRDGFVISEGSAIVIMESEEHARARGAHIYAEVIGYGSSADAFHMAAPHENGRGAIDAMSMAMRKAAEYGVAVEDIDYINAHGTSTRLNDRSETLAIKDVLGEHAYNVSISSTKSMTGHLLGGAGAIETIICAKTIEEGKIAPTINLVDPDPECDLDYTPLVAKEAEVNVTMSNSFGFGGHNACIMLRKYGRSGRTQ